MSLPEFEPLIQLERQAIQTTSIQDGSKHK
jgi:hypothetical protein